MSWDGTSLGGESCYTYCKFRSKFDFCNLDLKIKFKWAILGLFFVYFRFFKQPFLQQMYCPSSKQRQDSNPRTSEYKTPPIITRPGLPPGLIFLGELYHRWNVASRWTVVFGTVFWLIVVIILIISDPNNGSVRLESRFEQKKKQKTSTKTTREQWRSQEQTHESKEI